MSSDLQPPNSKLTGDVQADLKQLGKYRIIRRIGAGGMGTVYLAEDTLLKRTVALKVLPKDRAENPTLVRRFQSEARASAQLTHKNIVGVYDAGQADGYLYIALEYIDGIDLHEWLKKRETIPIKRSIAIMKQMAEALKHAHSKKLVHRDIKPANIMIAKDGTAKLADLGLARSVDETLDTTITRVGTTVGTVDYMSPEQAAHSKHADIRSDIYSLGCTWYHMLTGSPPYPDGDLTNKLRAHSENSIPDPREFNSRVTETIVAIMHRMMAKKKQDRYQTPQDFLDELNNSSSLADDSSHLLATLFEEEESVDGAEFVGSGDSAEIEVQTEPQSKLLEKSESETSPSTTPNLPKKAPQKKSKKKKQLKPATQQQHETKKRSQPTDRSMNRKPLKRARNAEELNEPEFATDVPQQTRQSDQNLKSNETRSGKIAKKKNSPATGKKEKQSEPSQKRKSNRSTSQKKESHRQSSLPHVDSGSESKIDVDWAKAGLFFLIVILSIGFIWWGISKFSVDSIVPDVNPYGDNATPESKHIIDASEKSLPRKLSLDKGTLEKPRKKVRTNLGQIALQPDGKFSPPQWVIAERSRPTLKQQDHLKVQRGKKGRSTFLNLEKSLAAVQSRPTVIDLSAVESQEIRTTELKLKDRLTIRASRSKPVLTFHPDSSDIKKVRHSWLNVTGGTLELVGLHFIISNSTEREVDFLKLNGTDLILRDCTFTTINKPSVTCVSVGQRSENGNRIQIENCLIRGENVTAVTARHVPCDIYCENSIFATRESDLIQVSLGKNDIQQSVYIANCTLIGGESNLEIGKSESTVGQGACHVTLNRSLLVGIPSRNTTAIQMMQLRDRNNAGSSIGRDKVTLKIRHVRFVDIANLTTVNTDNKTLRSITNPAQWSDFWGETLPSEDLAELERSDELLNQPSLLTATKINQSLKSISKHEIGGRSSLGADPSQVATIDSEAIIRQLTTNQFRQRKQSQKTTHWSGKTVRFDLAQGNLFPDFLASKKCPDGTTVTCFGSGIRKVPPIVLKNRKLRLKFEQSKGNPLSIELTDNKPFKTMFVVDGGELVIEHGRFEFRKSNVAKNASFFLESKNGANITLSQTQVIHPLVSPTSESMIRLGPAKNPAVVSISNSMISGFGPLIDWNATHQSLSLDNVILASGSNSLSITSNQNPGILSLNQCTFSQNKAAIHCKGSSTPITTLAKNCLFASPPNASPEASIIRGDSTDGIHETIDWWESSCGYHSKIQAGVSVPDKGPIGSFKPAWITFWGSSRVLNLLDGTREVVMSREIKKLDRLDFKDFTVSESCLAAVWTDHGTPIGAQISKLGPQHVNDKPTSAKRPKQTNTPAGF